MTDEQIIKAFECCTKIEEGSKLELCFECPMFEEDVDDCTASLFRKVLDLIKRQQAEIEALINGQETLQKMCAEAYKEFAERLKKKGTPVTGGKGFEGV